MQWNRNFSFVAVELSPLLQWKCTCELIHDTKYKTVLHGRIQILITTTYTQVYYLSIEKFRRRPFARNIFKIKLRFRLAFFKKSIEIVKLQVNSFLEMIRWLSMNPLKIFKPLFYSLAWWYNASKKAMTSIFLVCCSDTVTFFYNENANWSTILNRTWLNTDESHILIITIMRSAFSI